LHPNDPGTNANLGNALVQKGLLREAATHYEVALRSEPNAPVALNNLAWLLSAGPDDSLRNGEWAVELARNLNRVSKQNNPFFIRTLAAAYAEAGQFDAAVETAQGASELANAQGQHDLAVQIQDETNLYRQHLPLRDRTLRNAR
jgi:Flp pilus assembly protein TadD